MKTNTTHIEHEDCIFCSIIAGTAPARIIAESEHAICFLNLHPKNRYHALCVPRKHFETIFDIPEYDLKEVIALSRNVAKFYQETFGISNMQFVQSNGNEGQQDVFHFHMHILPRYKDDGQDVCWSLRPEFEATLEEDYLYLKKLYQSWC